MRRSTLIFMIILLVVIIGLGYLGYKSMQNLPAGAPYTGGPTPTVTTTFLPRVVQLGAQNNSGESGLAVISDQNGMAHVQIYVLGEPSNAVQPAHIDMGACPNPGSVVYSLNVVQNGKSDTVVPVMPATLYANLPLAINLHESTANIQNYISCGDL